MTATPTTPGSKSSSHVEATTPGSNVPGGSSRPLWQKGAVDLDQAVQRFCAADDIALDRDLFLYDLRATRTHVVGLERIHVLQLDEMTRLCDGLDELALLYREGKFILDARYEDAHTAIESFLTEKLGDAGRKVHTGRSRNDQVLVAQRLFVRSKLTELAAVTGEIARVCLERAEAGKAIPMPGYTHLQRAVPSSVGAWFAAFAESFLDDADAARAALHFIDACPLGTGAGYGLNLPLDRDFVAADLAFSRVLISPIAAQNSRGKYELFALAALEQALLDVRRFAWDLSLMTMAELSFVKLPDSYTTGSSLMPNKRNPDVVELLRTLPAVVEGARAEVAAVLALPSGYHRDLQATKGPIIRAFHRSLLGLSLMPPLATKLVFDEAKMRAAISPEMYATDRALELAVSGVPFRDAYVQAASEIENLGDRSPDESIQARVSLGGMGNLGLDRLRARLASQGKRREPFDHTDRENPGASITGGLS